MKRRGIYSTVSINERNAVLINKANFSHGSGTCLAAQQVFHYIGTGGGRQGGQFLKAVLLGERWLVEPEVEEVFTRTGLAHILAISGLHIGYLVLLLNFIQSLLKLRKGTALLFQGVILILYCLMTGASIGYQSSYHGFDIPYRQSTGKKIRSD